MFKDRLKKELKNIVPDENVKSAILDKIKTAEGQAPIQKNKATIIKLRWTSAVASLVIVCLVLILVWGDNKPTPIMDGTDSDTALNSNTSDFLTETPFDDDGSQHIKLPTGLTRPDSYESLYNLFDDAGYDDECIEDAGELPPASSNALSDTGSKNPGNSSNNTGDDGSTYTEPTEFSETNTQVEGVDESDIVKTNGKYIYILKDHQYEIIISLPKDGKLEKTFSIELEKNFSNEEYIKYNEMYVNSNRLIAIGETKYYNGTPVIVAAIYDITNPEAPEFINYHSQTGTELSTRISNGVLFVFSNQSYTWAKLDKDVLRTYVPFTGTKNGETPISEDEIYLFDCKENYRQNYLIASSVKIEDATLISRNATMGGGSDMYANAKNIYVVKDYFDNDKKEGTQFNSTSILRFEINDGEIFPAALGKVKGYILNQFSMAEEDGYFRIVTTVQEYVYKKYSYHYGFSSSAYNNSGYWSTSGRGKYNALYILDSELKVVGSVENLAPDEQIYSARLSGDIGYFVTFKQVDPLFAVDMSDPKNPKVLSKLKIPGFSSYLHPYGEGLLLGIGETSGSFNSKIKLSMFDVSDPADVAENHIISIDESMSNVLSNHKAALISVSKNIIGFGAGYDGEYYLFSYDKKSGFTQKAVLLAPTSNNRYVRGLFIGDFLYLCSQDGIYSYSMTDFKEIQKTDFN